jgi:serine/threonine protein kinase
MSACVRCALMPCIHVLTVSMLLLLTLPFMQVTLFGMALKQTSMDFKLMLVMECCTGSLKDCLEDHVGSPTISPVQVVAWLLHIARGMNYLHSQHLIHRDLVSSALRH